MLSADNNWKKNSIFKISFEIEIIIVIFEFKMKHTFKWIQTCSVVDDP